MTGKKTATLAVHAGRDPFNNHGIVNPPVYHASTVLFPSLKELKNASALPRGSVYYGRYGTPTRHALEEAIAALEGGYGTLCVSSGYAAITNAILAFVKPGDHVLMSDSAYAPTRNFCNVFLKRIGVTTSYYDPGIGAGISDLITGTTRVVFTESPGSLSFEMQDLPAITKAAHAKGVKVLHDNTWAGPILCRPFDLGVDISIQAGTKYIVGHADAMMGAITTADEDDFVAVKQQIMLLGDSFAPDDAYLALRGLRTLKLRLDQHHKTGLALAEFLQSRPEVSRVLHPALPDDPGHAIWRRDFIGASGLFSFILKPVAETALAAMLDHMALYGMGYSWGGFESLLLPADPGTIRTATGWHETGQLIRVHAGLEDVGDLIDDLQAGFGRLNGAA